MSSTFPIKSAQDWSIQKIDDVCHELGKIARDKYGLDTYPNQIEIVSSEQMLDAYSSVGMPVMYKHWSFGKSFVQNYKAYMGGEMGLAYELVINSSPCINYLMEENSMMMQALVVAHAAYGHNSFFKGNHLFKQFTNAEGIIDYLVFANDFIAKCEDRYGWAEVEAVLDAAHALQNYGVDKHKRVNLTKSQIHDREEQRAEYKRRTADVVMDRYAAWAEEGEGAAVNPEAGFEPQENLLYFIEKNMPGGSGWKGEILRIVRKIAQYFYPQRQTQIMNEGWATFWHYTLIHDLHDMKLVDDGFMLEFYESHAGVVWQHPKNNGVNPYALGWAMFKDIKRVAMEPTAEDREWFGAQQWVGCGDWLKTLDWAMRNFKDESFIQQFLSPKIIKEFSFFTILDDERNDEIEVVAIHNNAGFRKVRDTLANSRNLSNYVPEIQVVDYRHATDRALVLRHVMDNGRPLEQEETLSVLHHLEYLWGYPVELTSYHGDAVYSTIALKDSVPSMSVYLNDPV